jgi:hypothetical protein
MSRLDDGQGAVEEQKVRVEYRPRASASGRAIEKGLSDALRRAFNQLHEIDRVGPIHLEGSGRAMTSRSARTSRPTAASR